MILLEEFWEGDPYLLRFLSFSFWLLHHVSTAEYDPLKADCFLQKTESNAPHHPHFDFLSPLFSCHLDQS